MIIGNKISVIFEDNYLSALCADIMAPLPAMLTLLKMEVVLQLVPG